MSKISEVLGELEEARTPEEDLVEFLERIQGQIPKAIKKIKAGQLDLTVSNLVGTLVRTRDEEWFEQLYG